MNTEELAVENPPNVEEIIEDPVEEEDQSIEKEPPKSKPRRPRTQKQQEAFKKA